MAPGAQLLPRLELVAQFRDPLLFLEEAAQAGEQGREEEGGNTEGAGREESAETKGRNQEKSKENQRIQRGTKGSQGSKREV